MVGFWLIIAIIDDSLIIWGLIEFFWKSVLTNKLKSIEYATSVERAALGQITQPTAL